MWTAIMFFVILKIPVAYVCWVVWWAIKAEPEVGTQGGTDGVNWTPWRKPPGSRPPRGGPQATREARRQVRHQERTPS
jgi:hypothetical protein